MESPRPRNALVFAFALLVFVASPTPSLAADERPNILWITAEDMSPVLGCYGDPYARTPHIDGLAKRSLRYTRAFATAPVCSPARSCLITGVYATSLGTQHLRSVFPIPESIRGFPAYLREKGYYCSNNVKTDYNTSSEKRLIEESWDESSPRAHWRKRQEGQPFFAVFNLMTSHQSRASVWSFEEFEEKVGSRLDASERHDPAKAQLPPYYPDTELVRRTVARFYDCVTAMDREVGAILAQLEEDGLTESTIVFFYSDHGTGLPRGKRVLHDSGLRVPLLIHVPEKLRHWAPGALPGTTTDRMVSFVDFAPTVLGLAGIDAPKYMQGRAFLGPREQAPRLYVYGARDRVDEAFDFSRSVRGNRFLYIRNFMPHISLNQPEGYSDNAGMRREIARLAAADKLDAAQMTYAGPGKPLEELYDTRVDPHQITNLVEKEEYRKVLEWMRSQHRRWTDGTLDLGHLPEPDVWARTRGTTPYEAARSGAAGFDSKVYAQAAELVGRTDAVARQLRLMDSPDSVLRYWGTLGLRVAGARTRASRIALERALVDRSGPVRVEAASALATSGATEKARAAAIASLVAELGVGEKSSGADDRESDDPTAYDPRGRDLDTILRAARELQLLGETARPALPALRRLNAKAKEKTGEHPLWLFVDFATEAAVRGLAGASSLPRGPG